MLTRSISAQFNPLKTPFQLGCVEYARVSKTKSKPNTPLTVWRLFLCGFFFTIFFLSSKAFTEQAITGQITTQESIPASANVTQNQVTPLPDGNPNNAVKVANNKANRIAPDFMVETIYGDSISLYEVLDRQQSAVLVFWSTWCRFCKDLLPKLSQFQQEQAASNVTYVTFNIWEDSDPIAHFNKYNIQLPLVLRADTLAKKYKVKSTPGVFVIAPDKSIRYERMVGETTEKILKEIDRALRGFDKT